MAGITDRPEEQGVEFDLGNLLTIDPRPIHTANNGNLESIIQTEMTALTRIFLKQIWALPLERVEDTVVAVLPTPSTRLPREKPIPKAKPPTKWERYAKEKGIHKVKQSKMVWDQETRSWKSRFGYGKPQKPEDDWVTEVPDNSDGREDPFTFRKKAKQERVAKNELQRLKNIAKAYKTKIPAGGVLPETDSRTLSKGQVGQAAAFARFSTASAGKFDQNLPKEKPPKNHGGKKRKFEDNLVSGKNEKDRMMGILNEVTSKKARVEPAEGTGALGRIHRRSEKKKPDRKEVNPEHEKGSRKSFRGGNNGQRGGGAEFGRQNNKQRGRGKSGQRRS